MTDKLLFERQMVAEGFNCIGGMDEVGRGPLAGPVVAACVVLPLDKQIEGVDDSKKLSKKKREALYDEIVSSAVAFSVAFVDEKTIDEINILNATKQAMSQAVATMSVAPDCVLVDAVSLNCGKAKVVSIIKGDQKSYLIGAASIVAKVTRDRFMSEQAQLYPNYGFERNMGYGTAEHIAALKTVGACPIHRKTFIKHFVK